MIHLSGDYMTKVFGGAYKSEPKCEKEIQDFVMQKGKQVKKTYFFYTTCPKCANFMVITIWVLWPKFNNETKLALITKF